MEQKKTVNAWMTRDVLTICDDRVVGQLIEACTEAKIHGMPVVDRDNKVVGVISLTDIVRKEASAMNNMGYYTSSLIYPLLENDFGDLLYQRVSDIMTKDVYAISPHASLMTACEAMVQKKIQRLIVVDENERLLGIISASDLLKAAVSGLLVPETSTA